MALARTLVSVLAFLSLTAPAAAWDYGRDLRAADAYWHRILPRTRVAPCASGVGLTFYKWDNFGEPDTIAGRGSAGDCRIWIYTGQTERLDAYYACLVIVHERGHTFGIEHSASRRSIMFPVLQWQLRIPECVRATR